MEAMHLLHYNDDLVQLLLALVTGRLPQPPQTLKDLAANNWCRIHIPPLY